MHHPSTISEDTLSSAAAPGSATLFVCNSLSKCRSSGAPGAAVRARAEAPRHSERLVQERLPIHALYGGLQKGKCIIADRQVSSIQCHKAS